MKRKSSLREAAALYSGTRLNAYRLMRHRNVIVEGAGKGLRETLGRYYEEVAIVPQVSHSESGAPIGVGPGLCALPGIHPLRRQVMYAYTREIGGISFGKMRESKRISRQLDLRRLSKLGLQYGCCIVRQGEVLTHFFAFTFFLQIGTKGESRRGDFRTAYPCSSYEFACARSRPYWYVRK
jgi:hypothetical protein